MRSSPHPATVLLWYPKFLARCCSRNFDHCHSLTSLYLPLAALGSLPTGQLHLNGFESASNTTKSPTLLVLDFLWWGRTDSNHRSETQQIYSLSPLATRELPHMKFCYLIGAGRRTRTPDLLITNQLLYRLSYTGGSNRTCLL